LDGHRLGVGDRAVDGDQGRVPHRGGGVRDATGQVAHVLRDRALSDRHHPGGVVDATGGEGCHAFVLDDLAALDRHGSAGVDDPRGGVSAHPAVQELEDALVPDPGTGPGDRHALQGADLDEPETVRKQPDTTLSIDLAIANVVDAVDLERCGGSDGCKNQRYGPGEPVERDSMHIPPRLGDATTRSTVRERRTGEGGRRRRPSLSASAANRMEW